MTILRTIVVLILCLQPLHAQWGRASIDTVYAFVPGTGQNAGQGPAVFPANIFGSPALVAREDVQATDPNDVCSIGLGGVIVVGWKGAVVVDGPGADLTVFENAFRYGNGRLFAEPARIDVSADGVHWTSFPMDTNTFAGCAGMTPTHGDQDPWDPNVSGGDAFDLASIGVDSIRYVRITDVTTMLMNDPTNPLYDPSLTGFDLDAVLGLHTVPSAMNTTLSYEEREHLLFVSVSDADALRGGASIAAYRTDGTLVWEEHLGAGSFSISMDVLPLGCSFVRLQSASTQHTEKVLR
jgi:hypothetical protein